MSCFSQSNELRENLEKNKRIELRSLGLSAGETDDDFKLTKQLFLFPIAEKPTEFNLQSRGTRRYQGQIRDLVEDIIRKDTQSPEISHFKLTELLIDFLRF